MYKAKLNGSEFFIPASWEEVTLKQFFDLRDKSKDFLDTISILTNTDKSFWEDSTDLDVIEALTIGEHSPLYYISTPPERLDQFIRPDKIMICGKLCTLPKGLGFGTLAQKMAFEKLISDNKTDVDCIPMALAIYFQPQIDDARFSSERCEALIPEIMNTPIKEAFPVASFFFMKYVKYCKTKRKHLEESHALKRSGLELTDLKNSGILVRFGLWRRMAFWITRKFSKWTITPALSNYYIKKKRQSTKKN